MKIRREAVWATFGITALLALGSAALTELRSPTNSNTALTMTNNTAPPSPVPVNPNEIVVSAGSCDQSGATIYVTNLSNRNRSLIVNAFLLSSDDTGRGPLIQTGTGAFIEAVAGSQNQEVRVEWADKARKLSPDEFTIFGDRSGCLANAYINVAAETLVDRQQTQPQTTTSAIPAPLPTYRVVNDCVIQSTSYCFRAYLSNADLSHEDLSLMNLFEAELDGANLEGANLEGANLQGANLRGANLKGANLKGANLAGANLAETDLSGADLSCTDLYIGLLVCAHVSSANLIRANLSGANLTSADLTGANLSETNLSNADFSNAILKWASLGDAILSNANLSGTNLEGADLRGANLEGAILEGANLTDVVGYP